MSQIEPKKLAAKAAKIAAKKAAKKVAVKLVGSSVGLPFLVGGLVVFFIGVFLLVMAVLFIATPSQQETPGVGYYGGDISALGENEIPSIYIPIYKEAQEKYGVPWNLLAAHHKVETNFSTISPMISTAGAEGHMQFMPCTFVGWSHPSCKGTNGKGNISKSHKSDLKIIAKYKGYGTDGNNDGKADMWDIHDAIHSAARYLAANGAAEGRIREAVFAYNHADWYVNKVMGYADSYVNGYVAVSGSTSNTGIKVVDVGNRWIGRSVYVFGGGRNEADIQRGRFDCSSFIHWAFKETGVTLGPLTSTTTDTLKRLGKPIQANQVMPGDLVFFDTYKKDGHVGIYVGNGKFIGAQTSTGVAIADMSTGYWKNKFNGRVKRI